MSETRNDPPTLAQIKAEATNVDTPIWSAIYDWHEADNTTPEGDAAEDAAIKQIDGGICSALDAAYEAGQRDAYNIANIDYKVVAKASCDRLDRIYELEAWKASAMSVMAPLQDVAKEFGIGLGLSITEELAKIVRSKAADAETFRSTLARKLGEMMVMQRDLDAARAEIARLRAGKPEPVRHVAGPNLGARWEDGK